MISKTSTYSDYIPDYYHGTLEPELQIRFEKELQIDPALQQELDDFRKFAALYQGLDNEIPRPSSQLFAKIIADIDKTATREQVNPVQQQRPAEHSVTLQTILDRFKNSFSLPWGVVALQAVVLVVLLFPASPEKYYDTLSNRTVLQNQGGGETYNIVFKPETTEAEIRQLLLQTKATIISGPSVQGRYIIIFTSDQLSQQQRDILKNNSSILFFDKTL